MDKFDVVIIGGGPSGLSCAEVLGGSDLSVAVLDRSQMPGLKACAGGITPNTKLYEELPGRYREFSRHLIIINDKEFEAEIRKPIKVIDRADLADCQISRISGFGNVELFRGIKVESISLREGRNWVNTSEGNRIYFDYLVGAEGAGSVTRRFLGIQSRTKIGLHYRVKSGYDRMTWYFNPELMGDGYCWIFPHVDFLSCGILSSLKLTGDQKSLKILNGFMDGRGLERNTESLEGALVSYGFTGFRFGNIFLCGDAAGVAFPGTGEGIYPAMLTGEAAGRYLRGDRNAFSALKPLLRARKRQNRALKLFRALRSPGMQSLALEWISRLGSRHYLS